MTVTIEENVLFKEKSGGVSPNHYTNPFFLNRISLILLKFLPVRRVISSFSSKETIRARLKAHGVKLRVRGQHHGHPAQARFGERVIKGRLRPMKKELSVIDKIREMRAEEGLSLRKIAERLEKQEVPTKLKYEVWHPETVRRVLKIES